MINIKIFGVDFGVSVGFMCMLGAMLYIDKSGLMLLTLEATLVHELGHMIVLRRLGCRVKKIELKVGAAVIGGRFILSPKKEIAVALAGSVTNIIIFALCVLGYSLSLNEPFLKRGLVMLVVGVFNLLPIKGLDGGSVVYYSLIGRISEKTVKNIVFTVSIAFIIGIFVLGAFMLFKDGGNPTLILLSVYLFFSILLRKKQKE